MTSELEPRRLAPVPDPDDDQERRESTSTELEGPVYEGEIVDDDEPAPESSAERRMSDVLAARADEWTPVLPAWVLDREERGYAARWAGQYTAHTAKFHAVRAPKYAGRILARAPRGAARTVRVVSRWASDAESKPVRDAAVRREDAREYQQLTNLRNDRVRWRSIIVAAGAVVSIVALVLLLTVAPDWSVWAALAAAVAALGYAGRPADRPIVDTAVTRFEAPPLTSDGVTFALASLGIGEVNQAVRKGRGVTFPAPITRDGPGWRADVDLPHGVTPAMVMDRRDRLASGLRRPLGCVWPEPGEPHQGRLVLWVGDQDMATMRQPGWPLLTGKGPKSVDVFESVPFGTDQRGRPLTLTLMFAAVLIGAMPRYGKTAALRILVLALTLDPRVQLWIFELRGSGDLAPIAKVAHRYASGLDEESIAAAYEALQELDSELERRSRVFKRLPRSECPEGKLTPQLAARKDLDLAPIAFVIDECQELFSHETYGKDAGKIAERLTRTGPGFGVMALFATQRPDANSLPTGVSANAGIRFCLRVMDQTANDMVLGTSSYKAGIRATVFSEKDKGVGYLVGATDTPTIARSYYLDGDKAEKVTDRARELRENAGTLAGHAIGDAPDPSARVDLLADAAAATAGDEKCHTHTLLERLAEARPETYNGWTQAGLSSALKARGVDVGQRWIDGVNRQGVTVADLDEARGSSGATASPRTAARREGAS